ncbi:hypothetical protein CHS0354_022325 [Potamilus streckersoni]|uniref:MADS-box domain-containing protein n=1 Tax=Potamilus streckersoni TaxID=2493646 RepID=A0AAE0WE50_9BIVA|nr:hypothetical protein CHS0354_022325 [Potamilus streckersoni]
MSDDVGNSSVDKTTIVAQEKEGVTQKGGESERRMGRKKIQISRIGDERNRQVTFTKRKFGLMKKAYELSVLCDCEIALIIFNSNNKLFQYASTDMDKVLLKYTEYNEPHESRTNKDIIEALNKKEHKGCESPDLEQDPYCSTLGLEDKYSSRMTDDYQRVLHQNSMRPSLPGPYSNSGLSPGGMPLHNSYMNHNLQPGQMGQHNPNISSPGLLQVPTTLSPPSNSTGGMVDLTSPSTPNGYHRGISPCSSPGIMVNKGINSRQSPPSQHNRPTNVRIMAPHARNDLMNADTRSSSLAAPAVSLTTPSISVGSGYPSPVPSSYHTNDYHLNSGDLCGGGSGQHNMAVYNHGHPHWNGQGSLTSGLPHPGLHGHHGSGPLSSTGANLSSINVNTVNHGMTMNIKSEPISPPRDSTTPSSHHTLRPPSTGQGHLSPGHISPHLSHPPSNCSSPTGSIHPSDYEGPMMKRPRVDGWAT